MTEALKNNIIKFAKKRAGRNDIEFDLKEIEGHDEPYLLLIVDVSKSDKNNSNFDQGYYDFLHYHKKSDFLKIGNVLTPIINELKRYMDVKISHRGLFDFKNYEYLDKIENKIKDAISKSSHPEIEIEFEADWESPFIKLMFRNVSQELYSNKGEKISHFINEIEKLIGPGFTLDSYRHYFTEGRIKKEDI